MYSPKVTAQRLTEASKLLPQPLVYSSPREIEVYTAHFANPKTRERIALAGLEEDEKAWILNEQRVCALDFHYWASNYARIKDAANFLRPFRPRPGQRIFLDICAEMEEMGVAIIIQALKARQLGISTISELIVAHRVQFYRGTNSVIASSDPEKSKRMSRMIELCYENQPWWLMPCEDFRIKTNKDIKYKAGELIEFPDLDSSVSIQWGNQSTGIARGTTPTVVHLSELADFEHPEDLVDAALMPSFHDDPFSFMVLESTANGFGWWYKKWQVAKGWPARGRLRPMFLPWFCDPTFYPNPTWLKGHPIPNGWEPLPKTIDHARRAADYVNTKPLLQKYLGEGWTMPAEQQWFYETNKEEYAALGELNKWYQEMCADDLEAFQHKSMSIFDADLLANLRDSARAPALVCGLEGPPEDLALRFQPTSYEMAKDSLFKPLAVHSKWKQDHKGHTFRLIPLKYEGVADTEPLGKIFIYELPQEGELYTIGVDTSYGAKKDRTVVQVLRHCTPFRDAEQVAEFASDEVGAAAVWPWVLTLGTLYSTKVEGETRQAKIVIECGSASANGDMTLQDLSNRGWRNHHIRTKLGVGGLVPANQTMPQWGWHTTEATRGPMIDFLVKALRDGWLKINSPWFIYEMGELIRHEKKERLEASEGGHDDRLMALGIAFYSTHGHELYRSASPVWQQRIAESSTSHIHPTYSGGWQASDRDFESPRWDSEGTIDEDSYTIFKDYAEEALLDYS